MCLVSLRVIRLPSSSRWWQTGAEWTVAARWWPLTSPACRGSTAGSAAHLRQLSLLDCTYIFLQGQSSPGTCTVIPVLVGLNYFISIAWFTSTRNFNCCEQMTETSFKTFCVVFTIILVLNQSQIKHPNTPIYWCFDTLNFQFRWVCLLAWQTLLLSIFRVKSEPGGGKLKTKY